VHEFGHVLGLAHTSQNPCYSQREEYRPAHELGAILNGAFDLRDAAQEDFIERHIRMPWEGDGQFSDWLQAAGTLKELDSVMAHPMHAALLESDTSKPVDIAAALKKALHTLESSNPDGGNPHIRTQPSKTDIEYLLNLYPQTGISV